MKKLTISEMVSVILTLGVFLILFSLLHGWEKIGQERSMVAFAATLAGTIAGAFIITEVVAGATLFAGGFTTATMAAINGVLILAGMLAIVSVAGAVVALVAAKGVREIDTSKKTIWLSLGVEAAAIIFPILLITFH